MIGIGLFQMHVYLLGLTTQDMTSTAFLCQMFQPAPKHARRIPNVNCLLSPRGSSIAGLSQERLLLPKTLT